MSIKYDFDGECFVAQALMSSGVETLLEVDADCMVWANESVWKARAGGTQKSSRLTIEFNLMK